MTCPLGTAVANNKFGYIFQNLYAPEPDPQMEVTDYDRTDEENDELGLKDMKVDDAERS